jgi:hypothetical protein
VGGRAQTSKKTEREAIETMKLNEQQQQREENERKEAKRMRKQARGAGISECNRRTKSDIQKTRKS